MTDLVAGSGVYAPGRGRSRGPRRGGERRPAAGKAFPVTGWARRRRLAAALGVTVGLVFTLATPLRAQTRSSACDTGPTSPPNGSQQSVVADGTNRTYWPYVPSGYSRSNAYPLVFAFHGTGDQATIDSVPGISSWGQLFCSQYYGEWPSYITTGGDPGIVVCPDALLVPFGGGNFYTWVHANDDEFFDALLARLSEIYCIDLDRVFVVGHSVGGFHANEVACERGDDIRGLASIAGGGPFLGAGDTEEGDCEGGKTGKVAALIMHGADDEIVDDQSGRDSRDFWRADNGCGSGAAISISNACARNGSDTHETYQGCSSTDGYRVEWCLWNDVGHGQMFEIPCIGSNPELCGGEDIAQPATWEFFQSLAPITTLQELFSDGFEGGLGAWNASFGPADTSPDNPAEGSAKLDIDFDELAAVCSGADEVTIDTNGAPYVGGDATACIRLLMQDASLITSATFTAGVVVELGNGTSVGDGATLTLDNDASLIPFTYVQDDLAPPVTNYQASFELNVDDLNLPNGAELDLFQGRSASGEVLFRVVLTHVASEDRLAITASEDGGGMRASTPPNSSPLGAGWQTVEIAYNQGAGDGFLELTIEGSPQPDIPDLDNDGQPLTSVRLGYAGGARDGTSQNLGLDDFQSWQDLE